jgi:Holliday junction resolvase RusA-like endonuclease
MKYNYCFYLEAIPKGRPRFTRFGHAYTPKKTRDFEKALQSEAIRQNGKILLEGPLTVSISFYFKKPKSAKRQFPSVRVDLDNLIKATLDSMNGIAFKDDSQICEIYAKKCYGILPMILLSIGPLEEGKCTDGA